jgi:LDH2 family malate/lactate/ureidoglycolate dehydrogenase
LGGWLATARLATAAQTLLTKPLGKQRRSGSAGIRMQPGANLTVSGEFDGQVHVRGRGVGLNKFEDATADQMSPFHTVHWAERLTMPIGGKAPVIGTNPLSFAVPGKRRSTAFLIDQSSSVVAKSAVMKAASEGKRIPPGWALDAEGRPTEDSKAAPDGSMAPTGGYKGFGQGLIVEVMSAALPGALLGTEMASFIHNDGRPVDCGQFFIAIDPRKFSGGLFHKRIAILPESITSQAGARLPNAKRTASKKRLTKEGVTLSTDLCEKIKSYC